MQRCGFLIRLSAVSMLVLLTSLSGNAAAQGGVTWSEPVNLSSSPTGSAHPAIVATVRHVHVFWSETWMEGRGDGHRQSCQHHHVAAGTRLLGER
jgi:hypothetical protein